MTVPDGYTAYYTTDGSVPDAGATKYTAPVDLRLDAKVTFNVVLINNQNGKATAMTSKTYIPKAFGRINFMQKEVLCKVTIRQLCFTWNLYKISKNRVAFSCREI